MQRSDSEFGCKQVVTLSNKYLGESADDLFDEVPVFAEISTEVVLLRQVLWTSQVDVDRIAIVLYQQRSLVEEEEDDDDEGEGGDDVNECLWYREGDHPNTNLQEGLWIIATELDDERSIFTRRLKGLFAILGFGHEASTPNHRGVRQLGSILLIKRKHT